MPLVTVFTIGSGLQLSQTAEAVARGARIYDNRAAVHSLGLLDDGLSPATTEALRHSLGIAIGSSLSPEDTETYLTRFRELAVTSTDPAGLGIRAATTFTTLARDDPASGDAIDRMNRLLYQWGAVIVSPGHIEPAIDWLDNADASVATAERQGRRLGSLAGILGGDLDRRARVEL